MIFADKETMEKEVLYKKALELLKAKNLRDEGKRIRLLNLKKKTEVYREWNGKKGKSKYSKRQDRCDCFNDSVHHAYSESFKEMKTNPKVQEMLEV